MLGKIQMFSCKEQTFMRRSLTLPLNNGKVAA